MVSKEEAKRFLSDVPSDKQFWVHNSQLLKNMAQLSACLEKISTETYSYHQNKEKHDFGNWVRDVIGDLSLAESLIKCQTKGRAFQLVSTRLKFLNSKAK